MFKKAILIFSFLLPLIMVAQDVEVINHKGTKIKIANNKVTTATSAPTTPAPFKGDIWIDNTDPTHLMTYLWNGSVWVPLTENNHIKAMGKVAANGTALKIKGATVQRLNTGTYRITLNQALPTAHYIIQLTCFEINMWSNRDDINIHVTSQTTSTFDVLIHEGDNGANGNASRDKDWHFVVTDF